MLLGLSARSIRRLRAAFLERGAAALVHGNRGRAVAHRLDPVLVTRVVALPVTAKPSANEVNLIGA